MIVDGLSERHAEGCDHSLVVGPLIPFVIRGLGWQVLEPGRRSRKRPFARGQKKKSKPGDLLLSLVSDLGFLTFESAPCGIRPPPLFRLPKEWLPLLRSEAFPSVKTNKTN